MDKETYVPPILEIFEYEVERGFALSKDPTNIKMDTSDSLEDVIEGHDYNLFGDDNWF